MSNLDPRIEAVRKQYDLDASDFWQIPQNKQWVCKHAALEIVAAKAKVAWAAPQIIEARTGDGIAVLAVAGTMGDRSEWATGEASPKNNKNSYPWAMAEKRAKDRVILKLVGIHGLVYSEDEVDDFKAPRTTDQRSEQGRRETANQNRAVSKAQARPVFERLSKANRDCPTEADFNKLWGHAATTKALASLPDDWRQTILAEKADKAAELAERAALASDPTEQFNQMEAAE